MTLHRRVVEAAVCVLVVMGVAACGSDQAGARSVELPAPANELPVDDAGSSPDQPVLPPIPPPIPNIAPIAVADSAWANQDTPVTIDVLANDVDVENRVDRASVAVTDVVNGSATLDRTTGHITFAPAAEFSGEAEFRYTVRDLDGALSNAATVAITVDSALDFLKRPLIELPARSLMIERRSLQAGCGSVTGGLRTVDGDPSDWSGEPGWIAGQGRYSQGEFIWTDYPYDDDGTGTFQYPGEGQGLKSRAGSVPEARALQQRYGSNAADIVEFRAAADAQFLYLLFRLNFLNATDATVIGVALDADNTAATGSQVWPRNAGLLTPGADAFLTIHGGCAYLATAAGDQTLAQAGGAVAVDTAHNTIELALPRSGLADTIALAAGAGLWNPATQNWRRAAVGYLEDGNATEEPSGAKADSDPAVFNLLFRGDEPLIREGEVNLNATHSVSPRTFQTQRQNAQLSSGSTGPYKLMLNIAALGTGELDQPAPLRRGQENTFVRVYRSRLNAEGVFVSTGTSADIGLAGARFLGRDEPYVTRLPQCLFEGGCAGPLPLMVYLHGAGGSHVETLLASGDTFAATMQAATDLVIVHTLSRGIREPQYRGYGEADVLEVAQDVEHAYGTDPQRRVITGASMGGQGTLRIAGLYPQRWSAAFAHCPGIAENANDARVDPANAYFNLYPMAKALLNLPFRHTAGVLDPLTPIHHNRPLRDAALAAQLDYHYTEYPDGSHCVTPFDAGRGGWQPRHLKEYLHVLSARRVISPARVRYVIDPRQYEMDDPQGLGVFDLRDLNVAYRGAYWLLDTELSDPGTLGSNSAARIGEVELIDHTRPGWDLSTQDCGSGTGWGGIAGGNPDLDPVADGQPHSFVCQAQQRGGVVRDELSVRATNLRSIRLDARVLRLSERNLRLNLSSDRDLSVFLLGYSAAGANGECLIDWVNRDGGIELHTQASAAECIINLRLNNRSTR